MNVFIMKTIRICRCLAMLCVSLGAHSLLAGDLRIAGVFSDHAILQQNKPVTVWGTADVGEQITAAINGQTRTATADSDGRWKIILEPMPASSEAIPFQISSGTKTISLSDVLVGEVWFAAGQSNMTMPVRETQNAAAEIAAARDPQIREFAVIQRWPYAQPRDSTERLGAWAAASPEKVGEFSATGYYFARELRRRLNVPVGIIHASAGGIAAETLTPPDALNGIPSLSYLVDERGIGYGRGVSEDDWKRAKKAQTDFWAAMESPDTDDGAWEKAPMLVTDSKQRSATWFRFHFTADESWKDRKAVLRILKVAGLGRIALNGKKILPAGGAGIDVLEYKIAPGDLRAGDNVLAFRINGYALNNVPADTCSLVDAGDRSIALPIPAPALRKPESDGVAPADNISLLGNLFNGMVAPLIPFQLRGVIWYQGEANINKPEEYRTLFPALIQGWRSHWEQPELPFMFVQLAGFMSIPSQPEENSFWAQLREAQASALALPATAMAVALDLGDPKLIHPKNKQEVGRRLALVANKMVYKQACIASGPRYKNYKKEGNRIRISFTNIGTGLSTKDGKEVAGFAIAGKDKQFYWAKAIIEGNEVIIYADKVAEPVAVRYAWADNPECNLINSANLPAVPFRTDEWKGITQK